MSCLSPSGVGEGQRAACKWHGLFFRELGLEVLRVEASSSFSCGVLWTRVCSPRSEGPSAQGGQLAPAHVAGSLAQRCQLAGPRAVSPPPYFPCQPQSAAGALRSPFLRPPSLGLGSRASRPLSEAIKAPILRTQLCQPSALCPSPSQPHSHVPMARDPGARAMCRASERNQAAWAPTPKSGKVGAGVQDAGRTSSLSNHCDCDWQSSEEGPGLTGDGGSWDAGTWRGEGRFCFLNLGHGLSFVLDGGYWRGGGGGSGLETDCSHPERLENSPGSRRLGDSQLDCTWDREEGCPPLTSLFSLPPPFFLPWERQLQFLARTRAWESGDLILVKSGTCPVTLTVTSPLRSQFPHQKILRLPETCSSCYWARKFYLKTDFQSSCFH